MAIAFKERVGNSFSHFASEGKGNSSLTGRQDNSEKIRAVAVNWDADEESELDERISNMMENSFSDRIRKNKYRLYLNLQDEIQSAIPRAKISARFQLINWLRSKGAEGEWIIKTWKLEANKW